MLSLDPAVQTYTSTCGRRGRQGLGLINECTLICEEKCGTAPHRGKRLKTPSGMRKAKRRRSGRIYLDLEQPGRQRRCRVSSIARNTLTYLHLNLQPVNSSRSAIARVHRSAKPDPVPRATIHHRRVTLI